MVESINGSMIDDEDEHLNSPNRGMHLIRADTVSPENKMKPAHLDNFSLYPHMVKNNKLDASLTSENYYNDGEGSNTNKMNMISEREEGNGLINIVANDGLTIRSSLSSERGLRMAVDKPSIVTANNKFMQHKQQQDYAVDLNL